jgi:predicted component of type VI protein secretion system
MSDTPVVTPPTIPAPAPKPKLGIGWVIAIAFLSYFLGQGKNPLDILQPQPPAVVEPSEPEPVTPAPTPAEPIGPIVPDTPPVVEPEPTPPPKPMDETAAIARYAAEILPEQCRQDFGKMAEAAAGCADRIDAGHIRDQDEASGWLTVENRKAATEYDLWVPFFRAMQSRFKDLRAAGKMETLTDWSREFRSMGDGLAAAAVLHPIAGEPSK